MTGVTVGGVTMPKPINDNFSLFNGRISLVMIVC